ncbi:unnamed protein product, partial [Timema podura]|nr:unnamed protein product [Timema podura]
MCAMVNVILDAKNQSFKLCAVDGVDVHQYHTKIDDLIEKTSANMTQGMISKLVSVLETTLSKLSRYDEGSLIGSILSFTNVPRKKDKLRPKSCYLSEYNSSGSERKSLTPPHPPLINQNFSNNLECL